MRKAILSFNPFGKILPVYLLIVAMIATSCASYVKVHPEPKNIQSILKQGDTVKIVTKDNRETELKIVQLSNEAVIGENEKVLFTDISTLEKMNASAGKNAVGITGKILLISLYVAAIGLGAIGSSGGIGISGYGFGACR